MIAVQRRAMEHAMQPPHLTRRHLLQQSAIALLGAGILGNRAGAQARGWNNWSGNQSATPADILYPGDEAELCRMLAGADAPVRAFGGSHSFTPLVPTTGTLISLERMAGLIGHDAATQQATYGAGTRIGLASQLAAGIGQNLRNEPDINLQSLAGAIATATHGTGATLQSLSGYVRALKLVLAEPYAVEFMFREGEADNERGDYMRSTYMRPYLQRLDVLFQQAVADGHFNPFPPVYRDVLVMGFLRSLVIPGVLPSHCVSSSRTTVNVAGRRLDACTASHLSTTRASPCQRS